MTALRPGTSPPPVRMPIRLFAMPPPDLGIPVITPAPGGGFLRMAAYVPVGMAQSAVVPKACWTPPFRRIVLVHDCRGRVVEAQTGRHPLPSPSRRRAADEAPKSPIEG